MTNDTALNLLLNAKGKTVNNDAETAVMFKAVFQINYGGKWDDAFMPHNNELLPFPTVSKD